jgi:hypothetical protein
MKTTHEFAPADRYVYDFSTCTTSNGFAQVDTDQDASYFGTWANPERRIVICYCEGDVTVTECATDDEFVETLRGINTWNVENGYRPIGIDTGWNLRSKLAQTFVALGLGNDPFGRYVTART